MPIKYLLCMMRTSLTCHIKNHNFIACIGSLGFWIDVYKNSLQANVHFSVLLFYQKKWLRLFLISIAIHFTCSLNENHRAFKQYYYGVTRDRVCKILEQCIYYIYSKTFLSPAHLQPSETFKTIVWVQVNLIDKLNSPNCTFHHILHANNHFSKYSALYHLSNKRAMTVINTFKYWDVALGWQ